MKKVTLILSLNEALDLDYALLLASNEFLKKGWGGRANDITILRDRLSWRIAESNQAKEEDDALNGRR